MIGFQPSRLSFMNMGEIEAYASQKDSISRVHPTPPHDAAQVHLDNPSGGVTHNTTRTSPQLISKPSWKERMQWWILCHRAQLGYYFYGYFGPRTVRIGPKTMLKWGNSVDLAEAEAMRFVAERTSIPVPKVYDVWKHGDTTVIKMEYVRGRQAGSAWYNITETQQAALCAQLGEYVTQLRSLPPPSPSEVSSTYGGPSRDHRFGMVPIGPFQNHDDFHTFLRMGDALDFSHPMWSDVAALHSGHYNSKYTHGDLAPRNVLVRDGKIVAIIDWDSSGWRPEYWEYTKAHFQPLGIPQQWFDALKAVTGDFDEHLRGERRLWTAREFPASPGRFLNTTNQGAETMVQSSSA